MTTVGVKGLTKCTAVLDLIFPYKHCRPFVPGPGLPLWFSTFDSEYPENYSSH